MILDWFMSNPFGTEVYLLILPLIIYTFILWICSKIFKAENNSFLIALGIAFIVSISSFLIRSLTILLKLTDKQKPPFNLVAMGLELILLLTLIIFVYRLKWPKTLTTFFVTYFGKMSIMGIITFIIIFGFTTIPQDIAKERNEWGTPEKAQSIAQFEILQPTYIPKGYYLMSVKPVRRGDSYLADSIVLSYARSGGGSVISLHEDFKKYPIKFPSGGEPVLINGNQGRYYKSGENGKPYIIFYSGDLKFTIFDSIGNKLDREDLINIANSIPE